MALGLTLGYTTGFQPITFEEDGANGSFNGNTATGIGEFCFNGQQPSAGGSLRLGDRRYVFRTSLVGQDCSAGCGVLIGATLPATIQNLINAVNGGPGSGTTYLACCTLHSTLIAGAGPGDCVLLEQRTSNLPIVMDPPLETPPVGKFPTQVAAGDLVGWWRADRRRAFITETGNLVALGVTGTDDPGGPSRDIDRSYSLVNTDGEVLYPGFVTADSGFNGRPVIKHNYVASNDASSMMSGYMPMGIFTLPVHIFWILRLNGQVNNHIVCDTWLDNDATPNELAIVMGPSAGQLGQVVAGVFGSRVNTVTAPTGQAFLLEACFTNTTASFTRANRGTKVTGSAAGGPATGGAGSPTSRRFIVSRQMVESDSAPISWAELIIFRGAEITGQDYTDLTNYLANRYNLTLS